MSNEERITRRGAREEQEDSSKRRGAREEQERSKSKRRRRARSRPRLFICTSAVEVAKRMEIGGRG